MGRLRSENATLVFAVSVAVALGIACGAWINARLASAASENATAPARLTTPAPAATTTPAPTGDTETAPDDSRPTESAAGVETAPNNSGTPSEASERRLQPAEGGTAPVTVAPSKSKESSSEKASQPGRKTREAEAEPKAARARGVAAPCALYASASSLALRVGGAATIVLGGPGEAGRVSVSTPDWSDIAVFNEGRAGTNGWVRFSVRSVSGRAGVYTLHFTTPCGSQSIPVTVRH